MILESSLFESSLIFANCAKCFDKHKFTSYCLQNNLPLRFTKTQATLKDAIVDLKPPNIHTYLKVKKGRDQPLLLYRMYVSFNIKNVIIMAGASMCIFSSRNNYTAEKYPALQQLSFFIGLLLEAFSQAAQCTKVRFQKNFYGLDLFGRRSPFFVRSWLCIIN